MAFTLRDLRFSTARKFYGAARSYPLFYPGDGGDTFLQNVLKDVQDGAQETSVWPQSNLTPVRNIIRSFYPYTDVGLWYEREFSSNSAE